MEERQFPSHVTKQKAVSDTAPASVQTPPKQPHCPRGPAGALGPRLPDLPWEGRASGALPPEDEGVGSRGGLTAGLSKNRPLVSPQTPAGISAKRSEDQGWGRGWIWSQGVCAAGAQL